MLDKDPLNWPPSVWGLAIGISAFGGVVNWYARLKSTDPENYKFSIVELIGEVVTSGFVGVAVFMLLAGYGQPTAMAAFAAGFAGHMSTRFLFLLERVVSARMQAAARSTTGLSGLASALADELKATDISRDESTAEFGRRRVNRQKAAQELADSEMVDMEAERASKEREGASSRRKGIHKGHTEPVTAVDLGAGEPGGYRE